MSTTPPPQALTTDTRPGAGEPTADDGAFAWLRALGPRGRRAFAGAFGGYALDSYDYFTLPLSMVALAAYFGLDSGQTGLFTTVTLVVSAIGGAAAGVLADRIGRVKALMITVITYAVFTVACGFAPNYETLLVFRALQGLGFGGEWAVGAILVAEYASRQAPRPHPRRDPELLGGRLGARRRRLHAGLPVPRRRHRLARDVLDRRAARPARRSGCGARCRTPRRRPAAQGERREGLVRGDLQAGHGRGARCCRRRSSRSCCPPASRAATTRSPPGCRPT